MTGVERARMQVFNWLTFNNGFHTVHHDRPGVHWSLLPAEHARCVAGRIDPRLEQRSLLVYLFRTLVRPGIRLRYDRAGALASASKLRPRILPGAPQEVGGAVEMES